MESGTVWSEMTGTVWSEMGGTVWSVIAIFTELLLFVEYFEKIGKEVIGFWLPNDIVNRRLLEIENDSRNFCTRWWTFFELFFNSIPARANKLKGKIPKITFKKGKNIWC